jgi:hypothetical protein
MGIILQEFSREPLPGKGYPGSDQEMIFRQYLFIEEMPEE